MMALTSRPLIFRAPVSRRTVCVTCQASKEGAPPRTPGISRQALVKLVAAKTAQSEAATLATINGVLDVIVDTVASGERVTLVGFGTFERRATAARRGRNPTTGEELKIEAGFKPAFKPSPTFKGRTNGKDKAVAAPATAAPKATKPAAAAPKPAAPTKPAVAAPKPAAAAAKKAPPAKGASKK